MNGILSKYKLIGLDSNIFIYYFEQNQEFGVSSKKIFDALSSNSLRGVTSVISVIEAISKKELSNKIAKHIESDFSTIPNLSILAVDLRIGIEAAKIRREYGFRLPDSIQLATTKLNKAQAFISNDQRLKQFKDLKIILLSEI